MRASTFRFLLTACAGLLAGHSSDAAWETQQLDDQFYSEGIGAGDLDGDGEIDVVSGPYIHFGPAFEESIELYPPAPFDPHRYSDNFFAYVDDVDRDGKNDVVVIGFPGKEAYWYRNPGTVRQSKHWAKHVITDVVDNESPTYVDITGEGRKEIVCSRNGQFGYATPGEDPQQPWIWHAISPEKATGGRFTHGMGVGDVDGDGRLDLLEKSGWWQQPESLAGDPLWKKHSVEFSTRGGSQMHVYDIDGDGDNDVVTALEAHGYGVAWYEQQQQGDRVRFEPHLIVGKEPKESPYGIVFSQPHAIDVADIDGDGVLDVITGKRYWAHGPHGDPEPGATPVVYWFRCLQPNDERKEVRFEPHLISDKSGVGVEVLARDIDGDQMIDVLVGNKRGTFIHRQTARDKSPLATWQGAAKSRQQASEGLLPEEAAEAITVPPGFEVDLAAGEPLVHQPVAFSFDAQGRIWVAEAYTYPIRAAEGEGRDRIVVLEDTDKNGSYESRTLFTDGLNLISGLEVGFGGVWVGAAPYLMFIPDRNGDLSPDSEPEILLDGWGFQDTHETLNAFRWGPDGWLYGCQGVFTHSKVGRPGAPEAERTPLNACVWRYHPIRHEFEVFAHGTSNPWGVDFDAEGQAFITACVIPHAYHMIQGGRYQRQAGQHFNPYTFDDIKTIADHAHYAGNIRDHAWWGRDTAVEHDATSAAGGGHAHCGALIYQGDDWPAAYRGTLLMANIHGNRINSDRLRRDGSGFVASHGHDVFFANDPWFRGITIRTGPDGAVYISDWYDKNACHRRTPEIWDRTNGRIYRVRYGETPVPRVDLESLSDAELVGHLQKANQWYVRTARRILQARLADAEPAARQSVTTQLLTTIRDTSLSTSQRLDHLWTLHAITPVGDPLALELLDDPDATVRAWAIQLTLEDRRYSEPLQERLTDLADRDRDSRVQLYLASALQRLPIADRWPLAEGLAQHGDIQFDRNLALVLWYGIEPLVDADITRALALAESTPIPLLRQFIVRRAAGDPRLLDHLVAQLADSQNKAFNDVMLAELQRASERLGNVAMPAAWPRVAKRFATSKDESVRQTIMGLSVQFGDESVFPLLREIVRDKNAATSLRAQALAALARGKDPQLVAITGELLAGGPLQIEAIRLIGRTDAPDVAQRLLDGLKRWSPAARAAAVDALVSRPDYANALLDAIANDRFPRDIIHATHVNQILALENEALIEKLSRVWGSVRSSPAELQQTIAQLKRKINDNRIAQADPAHGRKLYEENCGKCHKLFGEGGEIGPDLTGANRGNTGYWLENIVDPNAVVGKDYITRSVLTVDGVVVTGLVLEETDTALVLQDADKKITIPTSDVDQMSSTGRSLMPEGQLSVMSVNQIADLFAYLKSPSQVPLPGTVPQMNEQTGRVPGALEGEDLKVVKVSGGETQDQAMQSFRRSGRWSGDKQLWWTGGKPGDTLTLQFTVAEAGDYAVYVDLTKARDYGTVRLSVDDHPPGDPIDLFNQTRVILTGPIALGRYPLDAGTHHLQVELGDPNPDAQPSNMFGIDYLWLRRAEEPPAR